MSFDTNTLSSSLPIDTIEYEYSDSRTSDAKLYGCLSIPDYGYLLFRSISNNVEIYKYKSLLKICHNKSIQECIDKYFCLNNIIGRYPNILSKQDIEDVYPSVMRSDKLYDYLPQTVVKGTISILMYSDRPMITFYITTLSTIYKISYYTISGTVCGSRVDIVPSNTSLVLYHDILKEWNKVSIDIAIGILSDKIVYTSDNQLSEVEYIRVLNSDFT